MFQHFTTWLSKGWSDVVLIERKELTSGVNLACRRTFAIIQLELLGRADPQTLRRSFPKHSRRRPGSMSASSRFPTSALRERRTAGTNTCFYAGVAKTIGVNVNVLTADDVKRIWPLCQSDDLLGAIQHPDDGYIQPADLTQALARGARARGAEIHRSDDGRGYRAPGAGSGWCARIRAIFPASTSSRRPATSRVGPGRWLAWTCR